MDLSKGVGVTTTDGSRAQPVADQSLRELVGLLLTEARITNFYLSIMTNEIIEEEDL